MRSHHILSLTSIYRDILTFASHLFELEAYRFHQVHQLSLLQIPANDDSNRPADERELRKTAPLSLAFTPPLSPASSRFFSDRQLEGLSPVSTAQRKATLPTFFFQTQSVKGQTGAYEAGVVVCVCLSATSIPSAPVLAVSHSLLTTRTLALLALLGLRIWQNRIEANDLELVVLFLCIA